MVAATAVQFADGSAAARSAVCNSNSTVSLPQHRQSSRQSQRQQHSSSAVRSAGCS